jgi:hypothetical protein
MHRENSLARSMPKLGGTSPLRKSPTDIIQRLNNNNNNSSRTSIIHIEASKSKEKNLMRMYDDDSITSQPDPSITNLNESPTISLASSKDFAQCNPSPISSSNSSYANMKSSFLNQNCDPFLYPSTPTSSTMRQQPIPRANFNLTKSRTTDTLPVSDRRFSGSSALIPGRPSDFPKTNFHLFGYRGRKSVDELVSSNLHINSLGSKTLSVHKSCMSMSTPPSTEQSCKDCEFDNDYPDGKNTIEGEMDGIGSIVTISQPGTPDMRKCRLPGNFMRRSATIAFSKGRKLSGLLGYSLPRR